MMFEMSVGTVIRHVNAVFFCYFINFHVIFARKQVAGGDYFRFNLLWKRSVGLEEFGILGWSKRIWITWTNNTEKRPFYSALREANGARPVSMKTVYVRYSCKFHLISNSACPPEKNWFWFSLGNGSEELRKSERKSLRNQTIPQG